MPKDVSNAKIVVFQSADMDHIKAFFRKLINFIQNFFSSSAEEFINLRYIFKFTIFCLLLFFFIAFLSFLIFLRSDKKTYLPNLINEDVLDGITELQKKSLVPVVIKRYSMEDQKYIIIHQKPEPGSIVKRGRKVTLFVSLGKKVETMPCFTNQNFYEVKNQLLNMFAGFEKAPTIVDIWEYSSNIEKDFIIISALL